MVEWLTRTVTSPSMRSASPSSDQAGVGALSPLVKTSALNRCISTPFAPNRALEIGQRRKSVERREGGSEPSFPARRAHEDLVNSCRVRFECAGQASGTGAIHGECNAAMQIQ